MERKIYYVAVFDRALTEQEIRQNYFSGLPPNINGSSTKDTRLETKGFLLRYLFDERKGSVIHDTGSGSSPVNLLIPEYVQPTNKPFLDISSDNLSSKYRFSDIIINILIFIPLGIFIHGILRTHYGLTLKISLATVLAGALFSICVELIQYFSIARNSSLIDVATNITGTAIGIAMDRCYNLYLNYKAKRLQMMLYDRKE